MAAPSRVHSVIGGGLYRHPFVPRTHFLPTGPIPLDRQGGGGPSLGLDPLAILQPRAASRRIRRRKAIAEIGSPSPLSRMTRR